MSIKGSYLKITKGEHSVCNSEKVKAEKPETDKMMRYNPCGETGNGWTEIQ